jgi:hypothetical protein
VGRSSYEKAPAIQKSPGMNPKQYLLSAHRLKRAERIGRRRQWSWGINHYASRRMVILMMVHPLRMIAGAMLITGAVIDPVMMVTIGVIARTVVAIEVI